MTDPSRPAKPANATKQSERPKGPAGVPGIVDWAEALIRDLSGHIPAEEAALLAAQAHALGRETPAPQGMPPDPTRPVIVKDRATLKTLAARMAGADDVVLDLETSDLDPRKGVIVGVGLAVTDATYYVPINHRFEDGGALRPGQLTLLEVLSALPLGDKPLINHNVKFEARWLRHHGGVNARFVWDTMLAARLLRPDLPADLEQVAARELDVPEWDLPRAEKDRIQFLPVERVAAYCAKDCWYTLLLSRRQRSAVKQGELSQFLMEEVEMPTSEVVAQMEDNGYQLDVRFFRDLRDRIEPEINKIEAAIRAHAEEHGMADFNPGSPRQLTDLLYDRLGLKCPKKTRKGSLSTDGEALKKLQSKHPVIPEVLRHRELHKVLTTYCALPGQVDEGGRLRVQFNQLKAETGRFSSSSVIQTIPKDDEFDIRKGFRAADGFRLVGADFNQQELRVLAQVSTDRNMRQAFAEGKDLHGLAAVMMFKLGCDPNEVKKQYPREREQVKSLQFGLIYGRTAHSLARALGISNEEADRLFEDYFRLFPSVRRFVDRVHKQLMRDGFVSDVFGRRRYFPETKRKVPRKKFDRMSEEEKQLVRKVNAARREAQNFVIQGASATITKLAMVRSHRHVTAKYGADVRMVLTLHDELHFEAREAVVDDLAGELPGLMCELGLERFGFEVPMAVEVKVGPTWGEMVRWEGSQDGGSGNTN